MNRVCAILFLLVLTCAAKAQEFPEITPETPVDTATLHTWLVSLDPHLIAWAADFARRRHDAQIVSEIPPLLQQWSLPVLVGSPEELAGHQHVVLALLDTLIQENATVPLDVIESVADQFPAQALILIKRLPAADVRPILMNWTFGSTERIDDLRARAAAMLLAENPDPAFVTRIVSGTEQHLAVHILPPGEEFSEGGSAGGCGAWIVQAQDPQWPITYEYELIEQVQASTDSSEIPVAAIGVHMISALRLELSRGPGRTSSASTTEAEFRHELIAHWLGLSPADMPWQPYESRDIFWSTQESFERELGAIIEEQRATMLDTFASLQQRKLLENFPEPRLVVRVECNMDRCPVGQPQ